ARTGATRRLRGNFPTLIGDFMVTALITVAAIAWITQLA
ncbi:hypothetical protein KOXM_02522, partial [Klebsiella michiganensis]